MSAVSAPGGTIVPGRRDQLCSSARLHGRANSFPRQVKQNEGKDLWEEG